MHAEAYAEMTRILDRHGAQLGSSVNLLDVGSMEINGSYRAMVTGRGWKYTGLDIASGPNVDVVTQNPYLFPFEADTFDLVISGSTMEHVAMPWVWVPELARVLKPGGVLAIITHCSWPLHEYPKDYWRFMPSGMELLFDLAGNLERYDIRMYCETDISGVAWRVGG